MGTYALVAALPIVAVMVFLVLLRWPAVKAMPVAYLITLVSRPDNLAGSPASGSCRDDSRHDHRRNSALDHLRGDCLIIHPARKRRA